MSNGDISKDNMVASTKELAYFVGIALGDGNLSNPNKRAIRLRITCDKKYPVFIETITKLLTKIFPNNKVAIINNDTYVNLSVYSNKLSKLLEWS
jgi:DNA-binding transcriptional regulator WhiA